ETRLNYGLPIHNPLLTDIVQRYPDVYEVAVEISEGLADRLKQPISPDEIGFITMYLSGALERTRLRPRKRAMVVCPSGMATAWILVSRIQSEFPQLDLVSVVSASDFAEKSREDVDMVISTVEVSSATAAVVVVNALLTGDDIRAISLLL
ncbi:MAG: PRD domain-containing protein, partial [Acidimicrobiia bacterium]|nr:PRD domain-containing protein [Acidimicrobiia bacterium]